MHASYGKHVKIARNEQVPIFIHVADCRIFRSKVTSDQVLAITARHSICWPKHGSSSK